LRNTDSLEVFAQEGDGIGQRRINREAPTPTPQPVSEDRSSSIRLNVEWPRAVRALAKNPILGTGYSSITLATDNDYLRALGEVGILGFVAFSIIFLRLIKLLLSKLKKLGTVDDIQKCFVAGTTGGLVGVVINASFIDVFEASKFAIIFWLFLGFLAGALRRKDYVG
jgi:O-antigen ligase